MDERGMTLIELLIVSVVIAILVLVVSFTFTGWQTRYKVEAQVKELYGDLMEMRMRALQTNTMHFIWLNDSDDTEYFRYRVYRDSDNDNSAEETTDAQITELSKEGLNYAIRWNGPNAPVKLEMDSRGLSKAGFCDGEPTKICKEDSECDADQDCEDRIIWIVDAEGKIFLLKKDGGSDGVHNIDIEVDYDCVVLTNTRINMGKLDKKPANGGTCVAK
jgi:prepilin-type N-terminal cleavage/methylation domain-containing protein